MAAVVSLVWFDLLFYLSQTIPIDQNWQWDRIMRAAHSFSQPGYRKNVFKCIQAFFFFIQTTYYIVTYSFSHVLDLSRCSHLFYSGFFCHLALKWGLKLLEILNVCASKTSWFTYRKTGTKTMHSINPSAQFKQNEIIQWMCQNDTTSTTMSIL